MDGKALFVQAVERMSATALSALARASWSIDDVDCFISHQANIRIGQAVAQEMNIPEDRIFIRLQKRGPNDHPTYPPGELTWPTPGDRRAARQRRHWVGWAPASGRAIGAGSSAPDARLRLSSTGTEVTLFDLYRGTHFTLLAFGTGGASRAQAIGQRFGGEVRAYVVASGSTAADPTEREATGIADVLLDSRDSARRAYGAVDGDTVLIRPDGYVAVVAPGADGEDVLERYLGRLLGSIALAPSGTHGSAGTTSEIPV
jgi:hypothetical protein